MFNFSTTTIINSDKDMSGKTMFSSITASGSHDAILRIKNDFSLEKPYIKKVYKKVAANPVVAEFTIDCTKLLAALPASPVYPITGRIGIYVALEGSEESGFANDFYQKGLPFSIGYVIKDAAVTAAQLATQIAATAKKYNLATVGKRNFDVTSATDKVTFKCTGEYLRFKSMVVLMDDGLTEKEIVHLFDGEQGNTQDVIEVVNRGKNGFGTFSHLLKDLRLPTAENTSWTAINSSERPVPGALYNQYTVHYKAPSDTNPSLAAVGHETDSRTTHIFWVRQDFATSFEAAVAAVLGGPAAAGADKIFEELT